MATMMLAGCSSVQGFAQSVGLCPDPELVIAPSTYCQYEPIEARLADPAAVPGTPEFEAFKVRVRAALGDENTERLRGNNAVYQELCQ